MLFKKLFQMLVLGGAVVGAASGCASRADAQTAPMKGGSMRDGGTAPDAGASNDASGGGVKGW